MEVGEDVKVVVAPDGFGGTLSAREVATAIAHGWRSVRADDRVVTVPMSDGGEGLLDAVASPDDSWIVTEVAGPLGHPVEAPLLLRADGTAVVESARACGLALVPAERRTPMLATTYGVGQLLDAAREAGATRILVGLGGSATVDGGAGALSGLGFRLRVADGSGLKVGADDLHRIDRIERGWVADWSGVEVELLSDVTTVLLDAPARFGPQKGASERDIAALTKALHRWAEVVERDLVERDLVERGRVERGREAVEPGRAAVEPGRAAERGLHEEPGTGAAGGLGYALAVAIGARFRTGSARVAQLVGLDPALDGADVVITGEGRLDATTAEGKVVAHVADQARDRGIPILAVVGQHADGAPDLDDVEAASQSGPGPTPDADVRAAAERLAARH